MSEPQLIRRDLDVELVVRAPAEGSDERIIEGIVVPWDQVATVRSEGEYKTPGTIYRETIARGAASGIDPERVTLESIEHKGKLVGRGVIAEDRPEGLHMALKVARTAAGDELLELSRERVLTGMSIVFAPREERERPDGVVERTSIDIRRVAVLERGAYAAAQVSAVRAEPVPEPTPPPPVERKSPVTDSLALHPVEQEARITELEGSIKAQAEAQRGIPSVEDQARWDSDTKELDQLLAARAVRASRSAYVGKLGETTTNTAPYSPPNIIRSTDPYDLGQYGPGAVRSFEERDQKLRDNAMRSLDASSFAQSTVDQAKAKEGVQDLLDNHDSRDKELAFRMLITGSPQYKRDFATSLQQMRPVGMVANTAERAAALAVTGTTTTGGYMLPYTFDPTFIKTGAWTAINPFRQICRVEQIVGSNNWQGVSVGAVPAIYETEALAVTEAGPTFARPSLTAQRASSFVSLSYETLQDRPDVVSEIADLIQEGKDTLEEAQFAIGVGTTVYPLGMFVKSTFTVKETITNDTFAVADLDATEAALPIRHRANAVWGFSRAVIRIIQGFETAYGKYFNSTLGYPAVGDPGFNPGGNTGLNLLGYPVYEFPSAPVTVTGDDTIVGILVSPKNYMILDRVGMNVELIPNLVDGDGKPTGQRGILALWRNTAKALNADAGRQVNIN